MGLHYNVTTFQSVTMRLVVTVVRYTRSGDYMANTSFSVSNTICSKG